MRGISCWHSLIVSMLLIPAVVRGDGLLSPIDILRVPNGGIQPQVAIDGNGTVHMLYYRGDAAAGDIYYVNRRHNEAAFSSPLRVNSQTGSAVAMGTIRGAQLALGRDGRVHVAWNGSQTAQPKGIPNPELPPESPYRLSSPMLYTRLAKDGSGFETQRNLMTHTYALDGGGSLAADTQGNVFVAWHANTVSVEQTGEGSRSVWVAISHDDGANFAPEIRANPCAHRCVRLLQLACGGRCTRLAVHCIPIGDGQSAPGYVLVSIGR